MLLNSTLVGARSTTLPAYITMISSVRVATTPEVVGDEDHGHVAVVLQLAQQVEDLRLHRDVEPGGGLVGHEEAGGAGEGDGDHDALAHAARELRRVGLVALDGGGDADLHQEGERRLLGLALGELEVDRSGSVIWWPIRCTGLSEVIGSWKTMAMCVLQSLRSWSFGALRISVPS